MESLDDVIDVAEPRRTEVGDDISVKLELPKLTVLVVMMTIVHDVMISVCEVYMILNVDEMSCTVVVALSMEFVENPIDVLIGGLLDVESAVLDVGVSLDGGLIELEL